MLFFIFEFIWVHNGAERWVRCRFSWLASKVVSSLKLISFHIITVIIISIIVIIIFIITIILYLEYLDFSLFSLKARKKYSINTKLFFWEMNRITGFPTPLISLWGKKRKILGFLPVSITLWKKCHISELFGLLVHISGLGTVLSLVLN